MLLSLDKKSGTEDIIRERFNELSDHFPSVVDSSDIRIRSVLQYFGDVRGKRILDAGCGKGRFSDLLLKAGAEVVGIDFSDELLQATRNINGGFFTQGSLTRLPFKDNSFDYVFSIEVLEHIPDTEIAISELIRVLRTNGKILIIDKNKCSLHQKLFVPRILIKKYKEWSNQWMYPKDFVFVEKWFYPWELKRIMKIYCKGVEIEFLKENGRLFSLIPQINLFIAWKGLKHE
ncbi:hypothetical protein JCM10550A_16760 [Methanogenium cariaci]|jgi:ubiquinone/menaquinone biosynthesis C-methylase UbiE